MAQHTLDGITGAHATVTIGGQVVRTASQAVDLLIGEGYARDDVHAAFDSLIDAGLLIGTLSAADERLITDTEVQILRDQLDSGSG